MLFCITLQTMAQTDGDNPEDREVDMDAPTFEPMVKVGKVLLDHDSVQYVQVNNVYVYPQPVFKNAKERMAYNRLVYNIKKVLPIAKEVRKIIIETGDYLETLPNKKAKDAHMKLVEKGIKQEYTPRMKKLTYAQGKLHQTGVSRMQFLILSPDSSLSGSYPCRILSGICKPLRCQPQQEVRPERR